MKRLITSALAALTFAATFATPEYAAAYDGHRGDHDGRRGHDGRGDRDGRRDHDGRGDHDGRRDHDGRGDRDGWRDHDGRRDRNERWDRYRHNGYNWNGRWYYGPAPREYYGRDGYYPGYRAWRRGDTLPYYYRNYYPVIDWRAYRLRAPPRGCHYIRDDRGEILLVGIATGVILSAILNNY